MVPKKLKLGIAIGIFALAAAYGLLKKDPALDNPGDASEESTENLTGKTIGQALSVPAEKAGTREVSSRRVDEMRSQYNAMIASGLQEIPTKHLGSAVLLSLQAKAEAQWCKVGDFDLIKALVSDPSQDIFLLSLEDMLDQKKSVAKARLSLLDIMSGKLRSFSIPTTKDAHEYGLYLCLDPGSSGRCAQKTALSPKDWNTAIAAAKIPEAIVYFQMLAMKDERLYLIPGERWSDAALEELQEQIHPWLRQAESSLALMGKLLRSLAPLPAVISDQQLKIRMLYNDPRCRER